MKFDLVLPCNIFLAHFSLNYAQEKNKPFRLSTGMQFFICSCYWNQALPVLETKSIPITRVIT